MGALFTAALTRFMVFIGKARFLLYLYQALPYSIVLYHAILYGTVLDYIPYHTASLNCRCS